MKRLSLSDAFKTLLCLFKHLKTSASNNGMILTRNNQFIWVMAAGTLVGGSSSESVWVNVHHFSFWCISHTEITDMTFKERYTQYFLYLCCAGWYDSRFLSLKSKKEPWHCLIELAKPLGDFIKHPQSSGIGSCTWKNNTFTSSIVYFCKYTCTMKWNNEANINHLYIKKSSSHTPIN